MCKRVIISLLIFLIGVIVAVSINFKSISTIVGDKFWQLISEQLEKEEREREASKYGGVGKDTIISLGDGKFSICKFVDGKVFIMYNEDKTIESLLSQVLKYKKIKDKLYVISEEGYGVADSKTNTCKLFVSVSPEQFVTGYTIDSEGVRHPISSFFSDEHIEYLETYDEFLSEEKAVFDGM